MTRTRQRVAHSGLAHASQSQTPTSQQWQPSTQMHGAVEHRPPAQHEPGEPVELEGIVAEVIPMADAPVRARNINNLDMVRSWAGDCGMRSSGAANLLQTRPATRDIGVALSNIGDPDREPMRDDV